MLLKAEFQLDVDVDSYVDAAQHQRAVEALIAEIRADYPQAEATIRASRRRNTTPLERSVGHG
jgi:hypothetical protein